MEESKIGSFFSRPLIAVFHDDKDFYAAVC